MDLGVINSWENSVTFYFVYVDGTFQKLLFYRIEYNPIAMVIGSFTKQHRIDLAIATHNNDCVAILLSSCD